ncbi:MAG: hypothetical protein KBT29_07885 [Prevotellaceae bacterium]|nr:hypothetical protein [Candidatus Minthosoma caballi]
MRTLFISIFAALAFAACSGGKTTAADGTADSVNVEAAKGDDFVSPDLAFFDLKGHVHTLTTNFGDEYVFDEKGTLLTVDGRDPFQGPDRKMDEDGGFEELVGYERDKDGYIVTATTWESETRYIWDEGHVIREEIASEGMVGQLIKTYNEDGTIAYTSESWLNEGEEEEEVEGESEGGDYVEYSDYKKDSHGNWISCKCSFPEETVTKTRKITYYDK